MINKSKIAGFTLVELMIVIVIVSIMAAIAYPSYQDSVRKSRRSEAKIALMEIANLQERFFAENNTYTDDLVDSSDGDTTDDADGPCRIGYGSFDTGVYYTDNGYYSISITNATAPSLAVSGSVCVVTTSTSDFTATATPTTTGKQSDDTDCASFSIAQTGSKTSTGGGDCW